MQHLLLRWLWHGYAIGGFAHGEFGVFSRLKAVAGRIWGWGDRMAILSAQRSVANGGGLPLLASFNRLTQEVHRPTAGYAIAGYQLDGEDRKLSSGRYRLEMAVPI